MDKIILNIRDYAFILAVSAVLYGCGLLPGDGAFRIAGTAPKNSVCELRLLSNEGRLLRTSKLKPGNFTDSFTVAPSSQTYRLQAYCNGKTVKEAIIEYGKDVTYDKPYNMGIISP
jgi:hypothetical protein